MKQRGEKTEMIDIMNLMWIVPFCLGLGFIFGEVSCEWNRKCAEIKQIRKEPEEIPEEEIFERDPMSLRNGFYTTRAKDPTFAEQCVNILNYTGESQTEGDYEESEGDNSAEDME